ncbi:F-box and leucine-rich repeat protein 4 [Bulinus truncatus]|nr:F-box and leucine-rich repeat protein 4 [Bulinus truncatus]
MQHLSWPRNLKPALDPALRYQLQDLCLATRVTSLNTESAESSFFTILPKEIIHLILSYLDVRDLCRLAQTCRHLKMHCYDPYLHTDLNLQPFWTQISSSRLLLIAHKCQRLQRLNLSWSGRGGLMSKVHFKMFLEECCKDLQTLELSCCNFVDGNVLSDLVNVCNNLIELNLHGCTHIEDFTSFREHPLPKLKRLNLYRTKIDFLSLSSLIRTSPFLEHLNIGSCQILNSSINHVMIELGTYSKYLKSLDLWRMKSVNDDGLAHLYRNCHLLEELDVGWCVEIKSDKDCYINLAKNCPHLKKLFLTANRTVRDTDLRMIASHCPLMEQLDILGTREVTKEAIVFVLETCKNLILLDVSFCLGISTSDVCSWRAAFPTVTIKKSFQNISIT